LLVIAEVFVIKNLEVYEMRINPIKQKISEGKPSIGVWQGLANPGISEILADAGFDWIVLDTEHGYYTLESLISCLDAMRRTEVSPIIRVLENRPSIIKQILDLGPEGIIIPMVNSVEDARSAVTACKYPPEGIRGVGAGRAARYGGKFMENLQTANGNILVVIQIEHIRAVENIDEIVKVEGVDCIFIGTMDLSASMGIVGQTTHPELIKAVEKVNAAGKRAGIATGMWCRNEEHTLEMIGKGMQFIAYSEDKGLIALAAGNSISSINKGLKNKICGNE